MNHPNGLVDPALVFVALPRKISFLAKSTLFKIPVISSVIRLMEGLPVYRRIDSADVTKNESTFRACHDLLESGGAIALFPEGVSHDSPMLLPIKTGAARIALGAISGAAGVVDFKLRVVPVGLYYTNKTTFRSEALLHFGESFEVEPPGIDDDGGLNRGDVKALTATIENALLDVTVNAETEAHLDEANESANLFFSVSETFDIEETIAERFEFVQRYIAGTVGTESKIESSLAARISSYKSKLRELGLEPEDLSLSSEPGWFVFRKFILKFIIILILSPFALIGSLIHFPAYQISKMLAWKYTKHGVDDIISTVKILSAALLMPVTWILVAAIAYYFTASFLSLILIPVSFVLGYIALYSWESYSDLRGWFKASWVFFTKRVLFREIIIERRELYASLSEFKDSDQISRNRGTNSD
jgi:1-acyl-sn-glycerol-3-phosphate acyltransferase